MKHVTKIGVLMAVVGGMPAVQAQAQAAAAAAEVATGLVFKAGAPVKIDGVLDEECWQKATPIKADYIWGKGAQIGAVPRMLVKYAWDEHYLYIGYEVFDTNLVVKGSGIVKGPADNKRPGCEIWVNPPAPQVDLVEFMVVLGNSNMWWELHHNAANQFNDVLSLVDLPAWKTERQAFAGANIYWGKNEYLQDDGEYKLAMAVQLKPRANGKPSTVNEPSDLDAGYVGELRLPWYGLGAPASARTKEGWKLAGREIRVLAINQNGDLPERYHTSCATLPAGAFFHLGVARYPRYRLVDANQ